jgi:hypothetical protein
LQLTVRRRLSLLVLGLAVSTLALTAAASKPRLRLERVDAARFADDGTVRLFASVVELEGNVDEERAAPAFSLRLDGKSVGRPLKAQPFAGSGEPLDLVLIVESSALYGPKKIVVPPPAPPAPRSKAPKHSLPNKGQKAPPAPPAGAVVAAPGEGEPLDKVKDAVHALLEGLSPKVRVLLVDYGADVTSHPPFRPAGALSGDVDDLSTDGEAGDLSLVKAVDAALIELNKPRPDGRQARRLIVVVSDGLNSQMDRRTFKALGDAAARARVPIHTLAFSPTDERGPLLNLGEISKRSNGTFRWAKTAEDLRAQIDTLTDELNKQYVLTFKLETRSLEGKKFQLASEELTSNILVFDSSGGSFGGNEGKRPLVPWWLWILAGLVVIGGGAAVVIARAPSRPKKPMKFSPYRAGAQPSANATQAPAPQPQAPAPPQPMAPVAVAGRALPAAATRGVLIVVSGALAGSRVDVGAQPVTVGKGPSSLQIGDDPAVSTRHAELAQRGTLFVVTDLGSTNGTFVNSQRITQPARLNDGDLLRFGNTQMKFRIE